MPLPSDYTSNPIIRRSGPASVVYDLSKPHQTTITLPPGSTWSSGLHWHERHTEYLCLIQGTIRVSLDHRTRIISAGTSRSEADAPTIKINPYERHEWMRADRGARDQDGEEEEPVVVIESTRPADIEKHLFFWNLNGVILDSPETEKSTWIDDWKTWLRLMNIFATLDNYPVFWSIGTQQLEWIWAHAVLLLAAWMVTATGVRAVERKYTPPKLYQDWDHR